MTDPDLDALTEKVIGLAMKVHSTLGRGLLESAYEQALMIEFRRNGLEAERQVSIPILYEDEIIEPAFRADIVVEKKVILELKSVQNLDDSAYKQLFTYLRLSGLKAGILFNFHDHLLRDSLKRMIL